MILTVAQIADIMLFSKATYKTGIVDDDYE